jgi:hypothetical protein
VISLDQPARLRVLARRGDRELALALQELERVARALRALLLDDRQDLVREVVLAHVEERLPGHRRVLDPLLVGEEGEHRLHERGLARRRRALDHDRERLLELARDRRQIPDELVGLLADHARALEVGQDAIEELGVEQELERRGALRPGDRRRRRLLRRGRRRDRLLLELLELDEHAAEIALDDLGLEPELVARLLDEERPRPRAVEVERVDEEGALTHERC